MKHLHFDFAFPVVAVVEADTLQQVPETAVFSIEQTPHLAGPSEKPHENLLNNMVAMRLRVRCSSYSVAEIQRRSAPVRTPTAPQKCAAAVVSAAYVSGLRTERLKTEVHRGQPPPTNLTTPSSRHTAALSELQESKSEPSIEFRTVDENESPLTGNSAARIHEPRSCHQCRQQLAPVVR